MHFVFAVQCSLDWPAHRIPFWNRAGQHASRWKFLCTPTPFLYIPTPLQDSYQSLTQAFNALSLFRSFSTYLRVTGDTEFMQASQVYLNTLADFYIAYTVGDSPLADYSADPKNYLGLHSTPTLLCPRSHALSDRVCPHISACDGSVTSWQLCHGT